MLPGRRIAVSGASVVAISGTRPLSDPLWEDSTLDIDPAAVIARAAMALHAMRAAGQATDIEEHLRRQLASPTSMSEAFGVRWDGSRTAHAKYWSSLMTDRVVATDEVLLYGTSTRCSARSRKTILTPFPPKYVIGDYPATTRSSRRRGRSRSSAVGWASVTPVSRRTTTAIGTGRWRP
ncbi:MAG: hypothetical protein M5T61_09820 [Acidimicrobiia bacterium]|nr:hypothetical protein [Acidimicrobiia bacterium]